jgi:hypothetical protein
MVKLWYYLLSKNVWILTSCNFCKFIWSNVKNYTFTTHSKVAKYNAACIQNHSYFHLLAPLEFLETDQYLFYPPVIEKCDSVSVSLIPGPHSFHFLVEFSCFLITHCSKIVLKIIKIGKQNSLLHLWILNLIITSNWQI